MGNGQVLDGITNALKNPHQPPGNSEALHWLLSSGTSSSDLTLAHREVPAKLKRLSVNMEERPEHIVRYTIDERALRERLDCIPYWSVHAREHDLNILTAIHQIRRARGYARLEECQAVLLTTNSPLIRAAEEFFTPIVRSYKNAPYCIQDQALSVVAWLKKPFDRDAASLPRKRIVADCYAALNPSEALWKAYSDQLEALSQRANVTNDELFHLRYSESARRSLVELTHGDPNRVSSATLDELRKIAADNVRAAVVAAENRAIEETTGKLGPIIEEKTKAAIVAKLRADEEHAKGISIAQHSGEIASSVLFAGLAIMPAFASIYSWLGIPPGAPWLVRDLARGATGGGVLFALLHSLFGIDATVVKRKVASYVTTWLIVHAETHSRSTGGNLGR